MIVGTAIVFVPALLIGLHEEEQLFGVWLAKALLNVWRLLSAVWLLQARFLR
jgi:hypothetical protein